jgi:hypothetical protein
MLSALSWTKGYSWLARRLKTGPTTDHVIDFLGQMVMPGIKQPLPPKTDIGTAFGCVEKTLRPIELTITIGFEKGAAYLGLVIGLSPVNDIDGAPDRTMKCRVALPVPDEVKRWKTMGFGTCQRQIVQPWSKLAQGWRPIMEILRLLQQQPEEFVVIRHTILPPSISFMQLPRLHSVSLQPGSRAPYPA